MPGKRQHPAWDQIESGAHGDFDAESVVWRSRPGEHDIELSKAISLKRIADALDGTAMGVDVSESLAGLPFQMIKGSLSR